MKKLFSVLWLYGLLTWFISCKGKSSSQKNFNADISADSLVIAKGGELFKNNCSACHNFSNDGIGPNLSGLTADSSIPVEWIRRFIKNSDSLVSSGDAKAGLLYKKYGSRMPSFASLSDDQINAIVSYINTYREISAKKEIPSNALKDPITDPIQLSKLILDVKKLTQFPSSSDSNRSPLTRITKLDFQPGTGSNFIVDLRGKLFKLKKGRPIVYMDIKQLRPRFISEPGLATGFGSFAFHPDFSKNGLLYTTHTESRGSGKPDFAYQDSIKVELQWVLTEWKATNPKEDSFDGTGRELLRINMVSGAHGVQDITFNPLSKPGDKDYGLLYIGIGDGASVQEGFPFVTGGNNKIWGTVICIDPLGNNSRNGKYGIPPGNPFAKDTDSSIVTEIYAYGFRNPHRITWTKKREMLVANIGQSNIEAIDLVKPGNNYGWPIREGSFLFNPYGNLNAILPLPGNDSIYHITYPIIQFDHGEGNAITGGYEYWGKISNLKGKFLFGDIPSGRLFYFDIADIGKRKPIPIREWRISVNGILTTLKQVCQSERVDLHFGRDVHGEILLLTKADGKLYQVTGTTIKNN